MKQVNIIIGRFQPFTLGHVKGAEYVKKKYNLNTLYLIVNTPPNKCDSRHPFPSDEIIKINKNINKEFDFIEGFISVPNANIVANIETMRKEGYEPIMWTTGSDRLVDYQKMINRYAEKIELNKDFKVIEIPRNDEDISATAVRNAIKDNDIQLFKKLMPKTEHGSFEVFKEMIDNVKESMKSLVDYLKESLS